MNILKQKKRVLSLFLAFVLMLTYVLPVGASAATSHEDFIRVFHLDVGRKYFTVDQVTEIIDALSASGYTHMELAIGNGGLRLLLRLFWLLRQPLLPKGICRNQIQLCRCLL